jgi:hypothetical protein
VQQRAFADAHGVARLLRLAHAPGVDGPMALALRLALVHALRNTFGAHAAHRKPLEALLAAGGGDAARRLFRASPSAFVAHYFGERGDAQRERCMQRLNQLLASSDAAAARRVDKAQQRRAKLVRARLAKRAKQRGALNDAIYQLEERRKIRSRAAERAVSTLLRAIDDKCVAAFADVASPSS